MVQFIIGLFVGGAVGFAFAAFLVAVAEDQDEHRRK